MQIATFDVRTLYRLGQITELTVSGIDHNIDIIYVQEHKYLHSEDVKYHDTCNGGTFVAAFAWKNSFNDMICRIGLLIGSQTLKSLNNIKKIQPQMMVATFNGNPCTTIISCPSPANVSKKTDLIAFYNELSSLVRSNEKHNFFTCGVKNVNNKFSLHNMSTRKGKYFPDFMLENK